MPEDAKDFVKKDAAAEGNTGDAGAQEKLSEEEQKALSMGWVPLDKFDGDEKDFIDAKEFINRAPLYERIHKTNKKLKSMEKVLDEIRRHNQMIAKRNHEARVEELKQQKAEAMATQEFDKVVEIDEELAKERTKAPEPELPPEFLAWQEEHEWYQEDEDKRIYADAYGVQLAKTHPNLPYSEVLKKVADKVEEVFAKPTSGPKRSVNKVATGSHAAKPQDSFSVSDLTDEQKKVMQDFIDAGIMKNEQEYIKQLADAGYIGN